MEISLKKISHLIPNKPNSTNFHAWENLKHQGWLLQDESNSTTVQAQGVLLQIYCYHQRSLNMELKGKREQPGFEEYALHFLFSNREKHNSAAHHLLMDELRPPAIQRIPHGESAWV